MRKRIAAKEREKAPTPIDEEGDTDSGRASPDISVENTQM